ncbi:DegT/DnrJ/EryC1/StrS family aminotransferase [bacterium]|nr:DegT/DnrJ/EryC1/StrS family aminotransferase [candidate division CSSED10-310 bacterium]
MNQWNDRKPLPGDLHVGKPNIGDRSRFLERINRILDVRWLTNNGQYVVELEDRIATLHGVKHCVAVCNGTVGLGIAIRALGIEGEAILPSYTFIATAHALMWQGIKPVFCDIDERTHNLNPEKVESRITSATTAIVGVHLWGRPCVPDELTDIAATHGLQLLFDAAHAFGCTYRGRTIGSFGDVEVLSFHATKIFNTAEGGAILTNRDDLAEKMRLIRDFGFAGYDNVVHLGINGKMNEFCAALGLTNLESLDRFIDANRRNYNCYREELEHLPGLKLIDFNEEEKNNWQYIVVEIDEKKFGINRDDMIRILNQNHVLARKYFWPGCHRMEPYRTLYPESGKHLPVTECVAARVLVLPTGSETSELNIMKICSIIRDSIP